MTLRWYVVHAYSNYENKVKLALEEKIELEGLQDHFGKIYILTYFYKIYSFTLRIYQ